MSGLPQKPIIRRMSSGVSEEIRFQAACERPTCLTKPFRTRSLMNMPSESAPKPASLSSSALTPRALPGIMAIPRRSFLASMPMRAVRVSTSCAMRQGIQMTESFPSSERMGQGITAPASTSFLATEQSAYMACAAVPALSRTSAVILPLKHPAGRECISSKLLQSRRGMNAMPRYSAWIFSGIAVSEPTEAKPDLSRTYSRAQVSSVSRVILKRVQGLGLPPSMTEPPLMIAGLLVKSGSALISRSERIISFAHSRASSSAFETSALQSAITQPEGDAARSLMADPRSPAGTLAKLTRFRWCRTSSGVASSVSSALSSGCMVRSASGLIQADEPLSAPSFLSSALMSRPRIAKRSAGSLSMSCAVRLRSAISWRHTTPKEYLQVQPMRSPVLSPHMSGIPRDCSLLTNSSSSFPTCSSESACGSFLSSVRTVSFSQSVKGSRLSEARSYDVVPCQTESSVFPDSLLNEASRMREAFASRR